MTPVPDKRRTTGRKARAVGFSMTLCAGAVLVGLIGPSSGAATSCESKQADITASIGAPEQTTVGEDFEVVATVSNDAPCPAPQVDVRVTAPSSLTLGTSTFNNVDFEKQETKTFRVPARATAAGSFEVSVYASPGKFGDPNHSNNTDTATVTVTDSDSPTTTGSTTTTTVPTNTTTGSTTTTTVPTNTTTTANTTTTTTTTTTTDGETPVEGETVNAEGTTGTVLVKEPGGTFREIDPDGELLPPGTIVNASAGTVTLTHDYNGELESMTFWAGSFKFIQKQSNKPITTVKLVGKQDCGRAAAARLMRKRGGNKRQLWGSGKKGNFRTRGRSGSATVRGTKWLTVDRCDDTTKFQLKQGRLAIDDFSIKGKVDKVLKGKGTYVAGKG